MSVHSTFYFSCSQYQRIQHFISSCWKHQINHQFLTILGLTHNHRTPWTGRNLKAHPAPTPAIGRAVPLRLPRAPSNLALSASRDGAPRLLWWGTGTGCPQKWWMPHPRRHSRSGWMGLWALWSSFWCPRSSQGSWIRRPLRVPSNSNGSLIPRENFPWHLT